MVTINSWGSSDPAEVAKGGTGVDTTTAYAVQCGGTTATGAHQPIASVGTSGQVLTSNGAGALPTMQTLNSGLILISSKTASSSASVTFVDIGSYKTYFFQFENIRPATDNSYLILQMSDDNGSTYETTGYSTLYAKGRPTSAITPDATNTVGWVLTSALDNSSGDKTASGQMWISNCNASSKPWANGMQTSYCNSGYYTIGFSGGVGATSGADAFRFIMSSGNIYIGRFKLFGLGGS